QTTDAVGALRRTLTGRGISLRGLLHHPDPHDRRPSLALVVEECSTQALEKVLEEVRQTGVLAEQALRMPIVTSS
ncbi:MAG TPA: hypothetical protein VL177_07520, partial [Terriglobales bacterium]|nr:hypothetical protein [Terriglobales bacterium]